ncbi:MFS transporter [Butyrivibrio sp. MC2013]|uniref:MFS transporter n=1 Tax=Butyrivibrio sp. MC2013 TaxID=1280686 RepID=UPI000405D562|nr:MFS transporter [Butyrivibrio sp. MC2013]
MKKEKDTWIYLLILIIMAALSISFVSFMGYLNYRSSAMDLEEQAIERIEQDNVADLETAIGFGKSFYNYYGMEDVFESFTRQIREAEPFILGADGQVLYGGSDSVHSFISGREFDKSFGKEEFTEGGIIKKGHLEMILTPIHQDQDVIGYFACLYSTYAFDEGFLGVRRDIAVVGGIIFLAESLVLALFVWVISDEKWKTGHRRSLDRAIEKVSTVIIMGLSIMILSGLSIYRFQVDYMDKMEASVELSLHNLEDTMRRVQDQGVDLREVDDLRSYVEERVSSLRMLSSVRISDHIAEVRTTDESSNLLSYEIGINEDDKSMLYLEAELSTRAVSREMRNIILILLSTMIILMIFVVELNNLTDLLLAKMSGRGSKEEAFSEKQVGTALRFTGFLCSTAEYMCVPYAAMLIRDSGEALFGLSVGMTAALPLTLEGVMQMVAMLCLPRFVKKYNVRVMLLLASVMMIICNLTAFVMGGALVIVICRALAGIAYAGFKQVSNYLITKGYETETGRSNNISQDNAGLLAGATCGAGLGAILSANSGYAITFIFSAALFIFYLLAAFFLLPWRAMRSKELSSLEEERPIRMGDIAKMIVSGEMLFYILVIGIPLNIGVMLCVTLIPAICQTNGISSVMLSYCYIANGIAGIYIGPFLVSRAKRTFGVPISIAFAFGLTAVSIFVLRLPPLALMIVITSMILGFLDGFATPMCTDQFMELGVVKNAVDESSALIFSVVISYVLITISPVIAELMLLPDRGLLSPMMIGAALYMLAALLVFLFRRHKRTSI